MRSGTCAIDHQPLAPSRSEVLTERRTNLLLGHHQEIPEERDRRPVKAGPEAARAQLNATIAKAMDTLLGRWTLSDQA